MEQNNNKIELGPVLVRRYMIIGERRLSNYWWAILISLGSFGFLSTGMTSYFWGLHNNLGTDSLVSESLLGNSNIQSLIAVWGSPNPAPLYPPSIRGDSLEAGVRGFSPLTLRLPFFPQGLLMSFYGSLGFLLSLYWWFLIFWNVGGGFNEFNKKDGLIRIFRWGYPGKNRKIDLSYSLKDVQAIKVELKQGLDPQRTIYLRLKGNREIPITGVGQPLTLKDIEKQASELANFLQVSLEGL